MRDANEVWYEIKNDIPKLNKEEIFNYTKFAVKNIFKTLSCSEEIRIRCTDELNEKLKINKKIYRISKDIDDVNIQYIELCDYKKEENEAYISVYTSIYFYDSTENNRLPENKEKYWNDNWKITFKCNIELENNKESNCTNCGALMHYDRETNTFKCEYCNNLIKYNGIEDNLILFDIEVN